MIQTVAKRFLRTFVAAFLAGAAAQLAVGTTISSVEDLKKLGFSLLMAGMAAGLMALDKLIRYDISTEESTTESEA